MNVCDHRPEVQEPFVDYLISETGNLWEKYIEHPFIVQLGKGTLPIEAFLHFLRQGYLYLLHYARIYAIAAYKAKSFEDIAASAVVMQSCIDEVKVNLRVSRVIEIRSLQQRIDHSTAMRITRYNERRGRVDKREQHLHCVQSIHTRCRKCRRYFRPSRSNDPMSDRLRRHREEITEQARSRSRPERG